MSAIPILVLLLACGGEREPGPPSVVLITIDTLRADYTSLYGFPHETTPRLDSLAARGATFMLAVAASTTTVPSHASIMTSRYPRQHSVGYLNGDTRLGTEPVLAEQFQKAGYATAAFVSNVLLRRRTGLDRGFDVYDDELPTPEINRPLIVERVAADTGVRAIRWLSTVDDPFFVWVHYQDPHGPYTPPEEWAGKFRVSPTDGDEPLEVVESPFGKHGIPAYQALEGLRRPSEYRSRYADEIGYVDAWIGRLVDALDARDPERRTLVLVTADHGESLGERDRYFAHGTDVFPAQAWVPFVLRAPGISNRRVKTVVSHVDVAPTLLELAGLPGLPGAAGIDVSAVFRGGGVFSRHVFCDMGLELAAYDRAGFTHVRPALDSWSGGRAAPEQGWRAYGWNGAAARRPPTAAVRAALRGYLGISPKMRQAQPPPAVDQERMRALGYVD